MSSPLRRALPTGVAALFVMATLAPSSVQAQEWPAPPEHSFRTYLDEAGTAYAPLAVPVFLGLMTRPPDESQIQVPAPQKDSETGQLLLKEGVNLVRNQAFSKSSGYRIVGDGTPPQTRPDYFDTPTFEGEDRMYLGQNPRFRLLAEDPLSGVWKTWITYEGAPYILAEALTLDLNRDQSFAFKYFSVDQVGNEESVQDLLLEVDLTPPVTRVAPQGPHFRMAVGTEGALELTATDQSSGVERIVYRIDDGPETRYRKPISMKDVPPGAHVLSFRAIDRVQNAEPWQQVEFQHDNQPPELKITIGGPEFRQDGVVYVSNENPVRLVVEDEFSEIAMLRYQIDEQEWQEYTEPFLPPQEPGLHWIGAEVSDRVGNQTGYRRRVYVDGSKPTTNYRITGSYSWRGDTAYLREGAGIEFSSTDLESRVENILICINELPCEPYTEPLSFPEEENYQIQFYSVDNVHNEELPKTLSVSVDLTPQTKTSLLLSTEDQENALRAVHRKKWHLHPEHGLIGASGLEFFLRIATSPEEDADWFQMEFDPDDQDPQPLFFAEGGKESLGVSIPFTRRQFQLPIDDTAPSTSVKFLEANTSERGGTRYFSQGLALQLASVDRGREQQAGVEQILYSIDGSGYVPYGPDPVRLFFVEKPYQVSYYAVDHVGNIERPRDLEFVVDLSPPLTTQTISGSLFGTTFSSNTVIELSSSDGLSGVAGVYYAFDNQSFRTYQRPLSGKALLELPEGPHSFRYYAVDGVGNREEEKSLSFTLDHKPPAVSLQVKGAQFEAENGRTYVARSTSFSLRATERGSELLKVQYALDNSEWETYAKSFTLPEAERRHSIAYSAIDRVGNTTPSKSSDFFLDLTPPNSAHRVEGTRYVFRLDLYLNAQTQIFLSSVDGAAGVKQLFYRINQGKPQPYRKPLQIKETGPQVLSYYAVDQVGNQEAEKTFEFFLDSTPPELKVRTTPPFSLREGKYYIKSGSLIHLDTRDPHSGVRAVSYSLDGAPKSLYRQPINRIPTRGEFELKVQVEDWVDNLNEQTLQFVIE